MARYFLRFRHSDTGLTPTFSYFKKSSDLSDVTPPTIGEVGGGTYYFDYVPTFDIVFEADGGAGIAEEDIRFVPGAVSLKEQFLDQAISTVKDDVWNDSTDRGLGTKGQQVEDAASLGGELSNIIDAITAVDGKIDGIVTTGDTTSSNVVALSSAVDGLSTTLDGLDSALDTVGSDVSTLSNNVGLIKVKTDNLPTNTSVVLTGITDQLKRALGLLHENSVLDSTVFDGDNNMLSGRLRIYDTRENAQAAGVSGLLSTYLITAEYTGGNLSKYTVVRSA